MEDQCSPLSWAYCHFQEKEEGIEDLRRSLLYTTLELETTIMAAHEQFARKGDELIHLKDLLTMAVKERDEARQRCQMLKLEISLLRHQLQAAGKEEDEQKVLEDETTAVSDQLDGNFPGKKPFPENGKFLQAVMEAGPLLQTLLLAGPLPQWQHPPPQLNSTDIPPPPLAASPVIRREYCCVSKKRTAAYSPPKGKHQKDAQKQLSESGSLVSPLTI